MEIYFFISKYIFFMPILRSMEGEQSKALVAQTIQERPAAAVVTEILAPSGEQDYYDLLGCVATATRGQIRAEFRAAAARLDPAGSTADEEHYRTMVHAFTVLVDDVSRAEYDRYRSSGLAIPFAAWRETHTHQRVMHWAKPRPRAPEIASHAHVPDEKD